MCSTELGHLSVRDGRQWIRVEASCFMLQVQTPIHNWEMCESEFDVKPRGLHRERADFLFPLLEPSRTNGTNDKISCLRGLS